MNKIVFLMLDLKSYYNSPAYQLGLLVAYANKEKTIKNNIDFIFREHPRSQDAVSIAIDILDIAPDYIAISNYSWNYKKICGILDYFKDCDSDIPNIVIGGPNSAGSFGVEMMIEYPSISVMIEGEGEPAFRDICFSIVNSPDKDPFANARNCIVRLKNGQIEKPKELNRINILDDVPSPYLEGILPLSPSPLFYETNRGCPYRCTFCYWGNGNSKVYRMSIDRITEEMEFFAKNKVGALFLADANFGIFPDDKKIAQVICDINAKNGYPLKHVGVNWAKNSSDRILEIASIFREGKIGVATTLAIQSVSAQAEKLSKRYAMPPSRFINLIKSADEMDIDTYTDLIWGLPGENIEGFLNGLEAVISTGVPSLLIHQLSLLPGTNLYESKKELEIKLLSEKIEKVDIPHEERSDYYEYIVVSHQDMTYDDMKYGTRIMGISHFLHNHDLGKIVNFYLARYDVSVKDVFIYFDEILRGIEKFPFEIHKAFINEVKEAIIGFAEGTGNDETIFYRRLSEHIWFDDSGSGLRKSRNNEVRLFMHDFYDSFCEYKNICKTKEEKKWLSDIVDYNWLISPKPTWSSKEEFSMELDVHTIWKDILTRLYERAVPEREAKIHKKTSTDDNWQDQITITKYKLKELLSDSYMQDKMISVKYKVNNPWVFPPSKSNIDWILTAKSKHCRIELID